ncbi:MAG: phosphoribosyl 1,2-cyclic phosphate phosphodiesterase [Gemmatimonadales bacterium]|jgi:phosphoribosyl 1,2-cyclic phosphate phosphodiesterase|nr:phosphoribosyl 1,2-cyclic phosphate phosphodiesterase [Gemmatimonadales bacterium]
MRLTFLGTGTSFGVPQIGCDCAVCRSTDPRDKRTRSGAILETAGSTILIDTPPELRLQLLAGGFSRIDAVVYTHEHADHVNGIDDLRIFSVRRHRPLPIYGPPETLDRVRASFNYIFDDAVRPYEGTSKPQLTLHPTEPGQRVSMAGVEALPLSFQHGHLRVFGYRFGNLAYITDVKAIPETAFDQLRGLDVLVLNALWWRPHPTHLSISEAVSTAQALGARRTYLTHLTHETGHAELEAQLPAGIFPAHDGLTVEVA